MLLKSILRVGHGRNVSWSTSHDYIAAKIVVSPWRSTPASHFTFSWSAGLGISVLYIQSLRSFVSGAIYSSYCFYDANSTVWHPDRLLGPLRQKQRLMN